jgi:hypothetical protein
MKPELHLLRKIERLPHGVKIQVGPLSRELGITQAMALSMLELLVHTGRLERQTLRPPAPLPSKAWPESFQTQLDRVERGEAKLAPVLRIRRPDPDGTLGGVATGQL